MYALECPYDGPNAALPSLARLLCIVGCPQAAQDLFRNHPQGGCTTAAYIEECREEAASGRFKESKLYFNCQPGPFQEFTSSAVAVAGSPGHGRGLVVEADVKAGQLLMCSTALAFDGSDAADTTGVQQHRAHANLAHILQARAADSALTQLRLARMCGGPQQDDKRVSTQLFRAFHSLPDLLSAESAAAVATDTITLEQMQSIVKRCSWAGTAASMWEGDPVVTACNPTATAWQGAFPPAYLAARAAAGDPIARALQEQQPAWQAEERALQAAQAHHMLFSLPVFMNHACVTNVATVLIGGTMFVRAACDIAPGQELVTNYYDVALPLPLRQQAELALGFRDTGARAQLEDRADVQQLHTAMHALYERLSGGCLDHEVVMSDEERLAGMSEGHTEMLDLVLQHEELLARLELQPAQRAWLRTSVVNAYIFLLTYLQHVEANEAEALQMALTVEAALRGTIPGSVVHVSAAMKLLDVARSYSPDGVEHAAAARLCRSAVIARYGDVDCFPEIAKAYMESDVTQW